MSFGPSVYLPLNDATCLLGGEADNVASETVEGFYSSSGSFTGVECPQTSITNCTTDTTVAVVTNGTAGASYVAINDNAITRFNTSITWGGWLEFAESANSDLDPQMLWGNMVNNSIITVVGDGFMANKDPTAAGEARGQCCVYDFSEDDTFCTTDSTQELSNTKSLVMCTYDPAEGVCVHVNGGTPVCNALATFTPDTGQTNGIRSNCFIGTHTGANVTGTCLGLKPFESVDTKIQHLMFYQSRLDDADIVDLYNGGINCCVTPTPVVPSPSATPTWTITPTFTQTATRTATPTRTPTSDATSTPTPEECVVVEVEGVLYNASSSPWANARVEIETRRVEAPYVNCVIRPSLVTYITNDTGAMPTGATLIAGSLILVTIENGVASEVFVPYGQDPVNIMDVLASVPPARTRTPGWPWPWR